MTENFDKWYAKNKEAHNAKRREKYLRDNEYRQSVVLRQREYRANQRKRREALRAKTPMAKDPTLSVTEVAESVARSPITVRAWEKRGLIPEPDRDGSNARRYTRKQAQQVRKLAKFIDETFSDRTVYMQRLPKVVADINRNW